MEASNLAAGAGWKHAAIFFRIFSGGVWYSAVALNTSVVWCGSSGKARFEITPPLISSVSLQRNSN